MRILQLGKFYPIRGGVEKVMWDLTRGLAGRGVDCDMVCAMLDKDDFDKKDIRNASVENGVRIIRFGEHGRCICLRSRAKLAATMISPAMIVWVRKHRKEYDIIHIHHPDPMACLSLFLSGYKGKVVLHWHSDILKQKGLLRFYKPLQRWLIRRADRIVGTTPVYVAASAELSGVQNKVTYLPIGIEDNIRNEALASPEEGIHTVFSLGRLVPYKGYRYLVAAAEYLPDNYKIVIGGMGPLREKLQEQIDNLNGGCMVELRGFLSDEEARRWFNSCEVFVLSSIMKTEAFGIVQLEAMSCGKPLVATGIPGSGTAWVNEDGVSGINVPPSDAEALAEAIKSICESPERYGKFSRDSRKRFERLFTLDAMIDGAQKIYESL